MCGVVLLGCVSTGHMHLVLKGGIMGGTYGGGVAGKGDHRLTFVKGGVRSA